MTTRKADHELAAKLKATVALAALRGDRTLAELAAEFNLQPTQVEQWRRELEGSAEDLFSRADDPAAGATPPTEAPPESAPTRPAPARHAGERPTRPQAPAATRAPTVPTQNRATPAAAALAAAGFDDDEFWEERPQRATGAEPGRDPTPRAGAHLPDRSPAAARGLFGALFVGWQEKHHAARTSRELLKLHREVAAAHPGLGKPEMYRRIVMAYVQGTSADAAAILERATESFAAWPAERPLTFQDVVHYLAVSDYLAAHGTVAAWTRENLGRVVAAMVPGNL